MRKLVLLGFLFTICLINSSFSVYGQEIVLSQRIIIDSDVNFRDIPKSFCGTEDNIFFFPDSKEGTMKLFSIEGKYLKFITTLGRNGIGKDRFSRPLYCFYSLDHERLGVFDDGAKRIYIYDRTGKISFKLISDLPCMGLDDIEFSESGTQYFISGYLADKKGRPYELYSIDIRNEKIEFLLESYRKYGLRSIDEYIREYDIKCTIPAVGIAGYMDILGDYLFFVYEGRSHIIKINLNSKESISFGVETDHYKKNKPNASKLASFLRMGDYKRTWKVQKSYAYFRNIFALPHCLISVYEIGGGENRSSKFRAQIYSLEGHYINDISIPGTPGRTMWMDKHGPILYSIVDNKSTLNEVKFSLLKYIINVHNIMKISSR